MTLRFQTPHSSFERRKWRRRLQRLSRNRLLKSLTKLRPRGLKTPVAVIVERVAIKNLQADIDGNVVNVGLFQTQAVWTKDRLDIDSVRLEDSSLAPAQTPPSDEPLGAMLKRTFSQPVVPEIPTVDLPLDVNLKHFELSRFAIKGNPDQIIESATFALTAQNGVATLENIAVRAMNAELTGRMTMGLDAPHEVNLELDVSISRAPRSNPNRHCAAGCRTDNGRH